MSLAQFHPAVAAWFQGQFQQPTDCQSQAWAAIRSGCHALIAAPTGSGKTLAAFLAAIDDLIAEGQQGGLPDEVRVVYVSPLKALSNDVQRNLDLPLAGIAAELARQGLPAVPIRGFVRTGDTPAYARTLMTRVAPHIVVTTPESLYILLTSESGRRMLASTRTVIVDEIHAVASSKRGMHLALSLERLKHLTGATLQRIGLSATQRPIDAIAHLLAGGDTSEVEIIDLGHARERDIQIEVPSSPLEAVMSGEVWAEIHDRLCELINAHRTTLVFVNTRRMAERIARYLSERIGEEFVTSHHGSLAREQRENAERRLKNGELKALVATASLELGIDIGDVDLVCQLGSPHTIAAFLQRVGRSGHTLIGVPKGRLFPLSRDDLVECAALLEAINRSELDRLNIPEGALDVLAQQIVAMVACEEWDEAELLALVRKAWPYRGLRHEDFMAVVRLLAEGYSTYHGLRSAYLHRDGVNQKLRARRGARLTAMTSGGTIPDTADCEVREEPEGNLVGTLNEDFAIESLAGDIFQLGNTSWRILRVETGVVRVQDAHGQPPNMPFWFGEAPARSDELSAAVSRLRATIEQKLNANGGPLEPGARATLSAELTARLALPPHAAEQLVDYLAAASAALGALPTHNTLILERFFDESGGMQLVLHSPYGGRINRALGLALRKRFCRKFNFELQAAAIEDAIVLSLSDSHSFPLTEVFHYLHSASVREVLTQAVLAAPLFITRWRWTAACALAIPRFRGGRKVPPRLQRMLAEDLIAHVFPDQIACAENLAGEREVPDHPLVQQSLRDCLNEAMDIAGLEGLLREIEAGKIRLLAVDLTEPSPLAQEILTARPYAFLDDAPLEERRTQAVHARRWLAPQDAADLGRLDPEAIAQVRLEAWPPVQNADEMHDALMQLGFVTGHEAATGWPESLPQQDIGGRGWLDWLAELQRAGRACCVENAGTSLWVAMERLAELQAAVPQLTAAAPALPGGAANPWTLETAWRELLRSRLAGLGPMSPADLARPLTPPAAPQYPLSNPLINKGFSATSPDSNNADNINKIIYLDDDSPSAEAKEALNKLTPVEVRQGSPERTLHRRRPCAGNGRGMVRTPAAGTHPPLHPQVAAPRDRAGCRQRLPAVSGALATRGRGHAPGRSIRLTGRVESARRVRRARRRLGARDPADPGARLRSPLAGRLMPSRGHRLAARQSARAGAGDQAAAPSHPQHTHCPGAAPATRLVAGLLSRTDTGNHAAIGRRHRNTIGLKPRRRLVFRGIDERGRTRCRTVRRSARGIGRRRAGKLRQLCRLAPLAAARAAPARQPGGAPTLRHAASAGRGRPLGLGPSWN